MTAVPKRTDFETAYAGQAPWDIGKPQKPFTDKADSITGTVLDAGCGTGDMALFFAGRGCKVTRIDFLEVPIQRAQRKATERGIQVTFLVKDALTLKDWNERFENVIDSGLFHVFPGVLQRRGAGHAGAEASVEGGTARRLRRGLEHRVHRAVPLRGPA